MKQFSLILILYVYTLAGDFTVFDNVIVDNKHKLMWQDDGSFDKRVFSWGNAIKACEQMTLNDYDDWRLPNIVELNSIVKRENVSIKIYPMFRSMGNANQLYGYLEYWSSSTWVLNKDYARSVEFRLGLSNWSPKSYSNYIRCVRNYDE